MVHDRGYIPYANSNNGRTVHPFAFFISSRLRERPPAGDRLMTSCCRRGAVQRAEDAASRIQSHFFLLTSDCRIYSRRTVDRAISNMHKIAAGKRR